MYTHNHPSIASLTTLRSPQLIHLSNSLLELFVLALLVAVSLRLQSQSLASSPHSLQSLNSPRTSMADSTLHIDNDSEESEGSHNCLDIGLVALLRASPLGLQLGIHH